jgi:hypothetical protein
MYMTSCDMATQNTITGMYDSSCSVCIAGYGPCSSSTNIACDAACTMYDDCHCSSTCR